MKPPLFSAVVSAVVSVFAQPVFAQPFAYVATVQNDTCAAGQTAPCTRGVINVINGATTQIVATR